MSNPGKINPVNWFEIHVNDFTKAKSFYTSVFGFEMSDMEMNEARLSMFPADHSAPGACGALVKVDGAGPSLNGTIVYFPVADIELTLEKIEASGGTTLMPKTSIGEFGHIGQFQDCEGNRVGLHTPPA